MVNMLIVQIIGDRIINKGENPKTHKVFVIENVTNKEYRKAVEDYILKHSNVDIGEKENIQEHNEEVTTQ